MKYRKSNLCLRQVQEKIIRFHLFTLLKYQIRTAILKPTMSAHYEDQLRKDEIQLLILLNVNKVITITKLKKYVPQLCVEILSYNLP